MRKILHFYLQGFQWTIIKDPEKESETETLIKHQA